MATHSSVLAWRIPGTGDPGGLPSMGSHRVGHDWVDLAAATRLMTLCIFSCACWSFVYLWRNVYLLLIFKWFFFFLLFEVFFNYCIFLYPLSSINYFIYLLLFFYVSSKLLAFLRYLLCFKILLSVWSITYDRRAPMPEKASFIVLAFFGCLVFS